MLLDRLTIEDVIRLLRKEESPLPAGTNHTLSLTVMESS